MPWFPKHNLLRSILLVVLAAAVAVEDFREYMSIRLTHAHAVQKDVDHCHPEIFGDLESQVEYPSFPLDEPMEKHAHVIYLCHDLPANDTRIHGAPIIPPHPRHLKFELTESSGPSRDLESLFRPPC